MPMVARAPAAHGFGRATGSRCANSSGPGALKAGHPHAPAGSRRTSTCLIVPFLAGGVHGLPARPQHRPIRSARRASPASAARRVPRRGPSMAFPPAGFDSRCPIVVRRVMVLQPEIPCRKSPGTGRASCCVWLRARTRRGVSVVAVHERSFLGNRQGRCPDENRGKPTLMKLAPVR